MIRPSSDLRNVGCSQQDMAVRSCFHRKHHHSFHIQSERSKWRGLSQNIQKLIAMSVFKPLNKRTKVGGWKDIPVSNRWIHSWPQKEEKGLCLTQLWNPTQYSMLVFFNKYFLNNSLLGITKPRFFYCNCSNPLEHHFMQISLCLLIKYAHKLSKFLMRWDSCLGIWRMNTLQFAACAFWNCGLNSGVITAVACTACS